jgi:hypothetical protein
VRYLNQSGQRLFAWLGVVAEDAPISPRMAATLWSTTEDKARKYLRTLSGAGLMRAADDSYRTHDLMHDLARNLLTAPETPAREGDIPGLGLTLRDAVRQFLERYRAKTMNGLWHTLPDDGYIHDRLFRHFGQAGWESGFGKLLWEETADGHCGWYAVRERLGQTADFLADVRGIWDYCDEVLISAPGGNRQISGAAASLRADQCVYKQPVRRNIP